jgi:hypothetical protein
MRIYAIFRALFCLSITAVVLSGCAIGSAKTMPKGVFETTVKAGDIRLFSYSQPLFREKARPITSANSRADGTSKPREDSESQLRRTVHNLEQDPRLAEYCPAGYTLIEQYAVLNDVVIRGECRYQQEQAK